MKKKNNKKGKSNKAEDMLIDFSNEPEGSAVDATDSKEEAKEEIKENLIEKTIEESIAASVEEIVHEEIKEAYVQEQENEAEQEAEASLSEDVLQTMEQQEKEASDGPTFVEIPTEGNSDIVVSTFLYTPSEEIGKELKKDRRKRRKSKAPIVALLVCAVIFIGAAIGLYVYESGLVYSVVHVEAGIELAVADLLVSPDENAFFTEDSDVIDINTPGEYFVKIHTGGFDHKCTIYIEDTTSPVVTAKEFLDVEYGATCEASDFITEILDATTTTVSFVNEPDYSNMEPQNISLTITDLGNNVVTVDSVLRISRVITYLEIEAGSAEPTSKDFMISENDTKGTILTDLSEIDFRKVGEYPIEIQVEDVVYHSVIAVVDTIAPVFTVHDIDGYAIVKRSAKDFVEESENIDITEVTYTFEEDPDVNQIGTQKVTIIGTDEGGNTCIRTANLTLKEDTEDPTIKGSDFVVYLGDSISYKTKVSIKDNCMEDLDVKVDSSKVNTQEEGTYPVTYTVTDAAGHTATLTVNMTIKKHTYDVDELNERADKILAKIITPDMSQYDKAWAVFTYIRGHVSYISESEKGDWVRSAFEGLNNGKGDCYVYASVSKLLLTRAGITNMDIERIPSGNSMHYWNLVDIGDGHGWYHFDTTPRKDHPTIFLWDDATIKDYSDKHNNCHNYDRSKYPTIN